MKINHQLVIVSIFFFIAACKKDATAVDTSTAVSTSNNSLSKTDGTITVQTAILPPVTPQTFITCGNISIAEFDIVTTKHILIYQLFFSANYPLIHSINIKDLGAAPNANGTITYNASGPFLNAGEGVSLLTQVNYLDIDSVVSGETAQLKLIHIVYRTDDEIYHDFYPDNAGKANSMCLVNNIPQITFQDPGTDTLSNGYKEIADFKFKGDTAYTITDLPIHLASLFSGYITKAPLIIRHNGKTIVKTDSVQLDEGSTAETVIHFNGFKHTPGSTDFFRIFAPVEGFYDIVVTTMQPLNSFIWRDGLNAGIAGGKNDKYFKEQTGQASFR